MMKGQLKQVIFLSIFGLLCCVFIFFVPWGSSPSQELSQDITVDVASGELPFEEPGKELDLPQLIGKLLFLTDEKVKNSDFISFLSGFSEKYGVKIDLITALSGNQTPDLVLLPYDQLNFVSHPLTFSQQLSPYFLTGLHEILNKDGFIPYALDPLLAYSLPELSGNDLMQIFQDRKPQRGSASFLFGPYQEEELFAQNLAFALMLNDFVKYNDYGAFHSWLAMLASPELRKQEFQLFQKISECRGRVQSCLIKKGFLAYGFSFLSDIYADSGFQITSYPYVYEGAPVRVYGFMIPQDSQLRNWSEMLIGAYLQLSDSHIARLTSQSGFWSVFPSVYAQQCGILCQSLEQLRILSSSRDLVENLFKDFLFKKLEEKKINPDLYLERALL